MDAPGPGILSTISLAVAWLPRAGGRFHLQRYRMTTTPPRLIFAGTPDFAVPSLQALLDAGYAVEAVYTQPDRPAGRGRQLRASPLKARAAAAGHPGIPARHPARCCRAGGTGRPGAGFAGGGRLRPDPAAGGAGHPAPGLRQRPRLAAAALARRGADSLGAAGGRRRDRRQPHADGRRSRYRAGVRASASIPIPRGITGGELYERLAMLGAKTLLANAAGSAGRTPDAGAAGRMRSPPTPPS